LPLKETLSPTAPVIGVAVIVGVIVKLTAGDGVALLVSCPFILWLPRGASGMVKAVLAKLPVAEAATVPTLASSKRTVTVALAANPFPLILKAPPTLPVAAPTMLTLGVMVNVTVVLVSPALVVMLTVLAPRAMVGTMKESVMVPVALT